MVIISGVPIFRIFTVNENTTLSTNHDEKGRQCYFFYKIAVLTLYYVLWPQEFSLSQVSDKVVMVIC